MSNDAKRPTMQEIADALGLHRRTVSAIVNGKARERKIAAKTEQRVLEYMDGIGYVPSRQARDLRVGYAGAPHKTGILFSGYFHRHMTDAFRLLTQPLCRQPEHAEIVIASCHRNTENLRELIARGCTDLLWLHAYSDITEIEDPDRLLPLFRNFRRTVVHNYRFGFGKYEDKLIDAGAHLVGIDRIGAIIELGRILQREGHRRVALFFESEGPMYARALRNELGLEVFHVMNTSIPAGELAESRHTAGDELLRLRNESGITAAIFNSDQPAADAVRKLGETGLDIPGDMSLVVWAGTVYAESLRVPLTAADIPVEAMVRKTLEVLDSDTPPARHIFQADLHLRESHGPAPAMPASN